MRKYVKLMADYCSSGVWDENGTNVDIDTIPMHYWLKSLIEQWQAWYDREGMEEDKFDVKAFTKQGFALAMKLKQNLPDWEVWYFSEEEAWDYYHCGTIKGPRISSSFLKEITL